MLSTSMWTTLWKTGDNSRRACGQPEKQAMPRQAQPSPKSQADFGFLGAPKRSENPRRRVETPKVENPGFGGWNPQKPAAGAEDAGPRRARRVRSFGEPGAALKSGFEVITRQVTLRSLTTFLNRFAMGVTLGCRPDPFFASRDGSLLSDNRRKGTVHGSQS